jgi:phosphoribosylformylglycinamidine synthase
MAKPATYDAVRADDPTDRLPAGDLTETVMELLLDPSWVYQQYDSQLFLNTVVGPGRDAALLRLAGPGLPQSERGIGLSTDSNPRWCALDPRVGTAFTVAEGVANLACVGVTAKAVVNCLNFGNPEHPEVMWQLSEAVDGMAEACNALELPVVGGNVSLYNESGGRDIDPTPVVGSLGVIDSLVAPPPGWNWREGDTLVLVGRREQLGAQPFALAGSAWARSHGFTGGAMPEFDGATLKQTFDFVAGEIASICAGNESAISAVHDIGTAGLGGAVMSMVAASGVGVTVDALSASAELLCEFPGRFVVATSEPEALCARAASHGVSAVSLGRIGGDRVSIDAIVEASVETIRERRSAALPTALQLH